MRPVMLVNGQQLPRGNVDQISYVCIVCYGIHWFKNTLDSRTVLGIALRKSNGMGGHYFMSLATDKYIHSNKWVEFPITNQVITKIHEYAKQDDQSYIRYEPFPLEYEGD